MGLIQNTIQQLKSAPGIVPDFTLKVFRGSTYQLAVPLPAQTAKQWKHRVQSITLTQFSGVQADTLMLELDNTGQLRPAFALPEQQYFVEVALGYEGSKTTSGRYMVTAKSLSGPPNRMSIKAETIPSNTAILSTRSNKWHKGSGNEPMLLSQVISSIATRNKLKSYFLSNSLKVDEVNDPYQYKESDLHYLHRLAGEHGAICKIVDGKIVFVDRKASKTNSNKALLPVVVNTQDILHWRLETAERYKYEVVQAIWHEPGAAQKTLISQQSKSIRNKKSYLIPKIFSSEKRAKTAVKAKLREFEEQVYTMQMTVVGNPYISARGQIEIKAVGSEDLPKELQHVWWVEQVTHSVNSSGYRCTLTGFRVA